MALRPKNWGAFQHYKNRRPPWIRLYHRLLDNPDFHAMRGDDVKFLVMVWLIASEHENGDLPPVAEIAFRVRIPLKKTQELLARLQAWFEQDASNTLASRKQVATPETEAEVTEAETEKEREPPKATPPDSKLRRTSVVRNDATPKFDPMDTKLPAWLDADAWAGFVEMRKKIKKPLVTTRAVNGILSELGRLRQAGHDPIACIDKSIQNNYSGVYPPSNGGFNGNQGNRSNYQHRSKTSGNFDEARAALFALAGEKPDSDGDGAAGECVEGLFDPVRQ